jgi:hypothetical protein
MVIVQLKSEVDSIPPITLSRSSYQLHQEKPGMVMTLIYPEFVDGKLSQGNQP